MTLILARFSMGQTWTQRPTRTRTRRLGLDHGTHREMIMVCRGNDVCGIRHCMYVCYLIVEGVQYTVL